MDVRHAGAEIFKQSGDQAFGAGLCNGSRRSGGAGTAADC